jgi:hypothetical protein
MTPIEDFLFKMELTNFNSEKKYSSRYLVEQINLFRKEEGNKVEVRHSDLLVKIEKRFSGKIIERKISLSQFEQKMPTGGVKIVKMYELPFEYCLRILMDESETVQDRCVEVMKEQQAQIEQLKTFAVPQTYKEALRALIAKEEETEQLQIELDKSKEWFTIKKVAHHNKLDWKSLEWSKLKSAGKSINIPEKKIFDSNFPEGVNAYHYEAWKIVYPKFNYNFS